MDATVPAVAAKPTVVEPAAAVTDAGTVRAGLSEESATVDPPAGAACDNVTVQLDVAPETKAAGVHWRLVTVTGAIVSEVVAELPFSEAVTVTA